MKSLLILRHAKSSWKDESLDDHDRPLNQRGKRDASRMGRLLREMELLPDIILCSTATRARKTLKRLAAAAELSGNTAIQGQLYMASPSAYIAAVRGVVDTAQRAMVIGHNPGLEQLLFQLTGADEPLPTAALAVIELNIDSWRDLNDTTRGKLLQLYRPKELADGN